MMFKLHDGRWLNTDYVVEMKDVGHGDIEIVRAFADSIVIKENMDVLCGKINRLLESQYQSGD